MTPAHALWLLFICYGNNYCGSQGAMAVQQNVTKEACLAIIEYAPKRNQIAYCVSPTGEVIEGKK